MLGLDMWDAVFLNAQLNGKGETTTLWKYTSVAHCVTISELLFLQNWKKQSRC